MGKAVGVSDVLLGGGVPPGKGVPPGSVLAITVTGFIDPITSNITLTVGITPPAVLGTFIGCHLYLEIPDQSASATSLTVGSTAAGTAPVTGSWTTLDLGDVTYVASQQPWTVSTPGPAFIDATKNTPCRLYAPSFSSLTDTPLVRANQSGASPNEAFTLVSLASGSPTSGTNVTTLTGGDGTAIGIVASVLSPVNVTGKLETPVLVDITDTPPSVKGWVCRLLLTVGMADPTVPANWQVVSGIINQAGPVYAPPGDGVSVPHSFILDTPATFVTATVWMQAGLSNASGTYSWNNVVPGITPCFAIMYGATTGTTDASALMTATITASMAVVNKLFGVAAAGITNALLGPAAVATINISALAVTNPLLAALCVDSSKLQAGSVTATQIAALAVGTAAIQTLAVTNALIANLAVSGAQIQYATITGAQIANATIAGANIGLATIAQANIANLAVGTAQIQNLTVTDAKISDLSVVKLTAGTANFSGTATFATGSYSVIISGTGITIWDGSSNQVIVNSSGLSLLAGSGTQGITINTSGVATFTDSTGTSTSISGNVVGVGSLDALEVFSSLYYFTPLNVYTTASSGSASALPSAPAGYVEVNIKGGTFKLPYYNV